MNDLFPQIPPVDGDENQKKAYKLWLLALKISTRLDITGDKKSFSILERNICAFTYVMWEMMEYEFLDEEFKKISLHYLKFPFYEVSKTRSNLLFRIKPIGLYDSLANADSDVEFDKSLAAIFSVDQFIKSRVNLYSRQFDLFYGPGDGLIPHLAAYLIYHAPLKNANEIDFEEDFWKLTDAKVMKIFVSKLEGFHKVIKNHIEPILFTNS